MTFWRRVILFCRRALMSVVSAGDIREILLRQEVRGRTASHPNPFCKYGAPGFSQADEDGLTLEIIRRLNLSGGTFCEFGVGDGTENNTIVLLANGWRGTWVGGETLAFTPPKGGRLRFIKSWITLENITSLYAQAGQCDVISLDLDGNDYHFAEKLLHDGARPQLFIVEYNGAFVPPTKFKIEYDARHQWQHDDYYGASLASFAALFEEYGYSLVCCNAASGVNAFFVRTDDMDKFPEVPADIRDIYTTPFAIIARRNVGRSPVAIKTLQELMK